MKSAILLIVCGLLYSNQSFADTIYLKNNHRFEGIITKKTDEGVWMRGGIFYNSEIKRIDYNDKGVEEDKKAKVKKEEPLWDKFLVAIGAKAAPLTPEEERQLRVDKKSKDLKALHASFSKERIRAKRDQRDILNRVAFLKMKKEVKSGRKRREWKSEKNKWIKENNRRR